MKDYKVTTALQEALTAGKVVSIKLSKKKHERVVRKLFPNVRVKESMLPDYDQSTATLYGNGDVLSPVLWEGTHYKYLVADIYMTFKEAFSKVDKEPKVTYKLSDYAKRAKKAHSKSRAGVLGVWVKTQEQADILSSIVDTDTYRGGVDTVLWFPWADYGIATYQGNYSIDSKDTMLTFDDAVEKVIPEEEYTKEPKVTYKLSEEFVDTQKAYAKREGVLGIFVDSQEQADILDSILEPGDIYCAGHDKVLWAFSNGTAIYTADDAIDDDDYVFSFEDAVVKEYIK